MNILRWKRAAVAAWLGTVGSLGVAHAGDVYWSVGVYQPGVSVRVGNTAPVVVTPPVVVAPPPVVWGAPLAVLAPPPVMWVPPGHRKHHHRHHHRWDRDGGPRVVVPGAWGAPPAWAYPSHGRWDDERRGWR